MANLKIIINGAQSVEGKLLIREFERHAGRLFHIFNKSSMANHVVFLLREGICFEFVREFEGGFCDLLSFRQAVHQLVKCRFKWLLDSSPALSSLSPFPIVPFGGNEYDYIFSDIGGGMFPKTTLFWSNIWSFLRPGYFFLKLLHF